MTDLKIKIVQGFNTIKKEKLCNVYEKSRKNHIFIFQFKVISLNNTFEVSFLWIKTCCVCLSVGEEKVHIA